MESREKIIEAAIKVFAKKGKFGTTMEEICKMAGYNKAMAYYHFKSKDNLYLEVLKIIISNSTSGINEVVKAKSRQDVDHYQYIKDILYATFNIFSQNQEHTKILLEAMGSGILEEPDVINIIEQATDSSNRANLIETIQDGINKKIFRSIDPNQFLISMIGICMIFFIVKPFIHIFDLDITDEGEFINKRISSVADLIFNGLLNRDISQKIND